MPSDERLEVDQRCSPIGGAANLAKAAGITLRNGLPDKKKVSRLLLKLCTDKLTRKTRDNWRLTKEGKSEAERVKIATAGTFAEAVK